MDCSPIEYVQAYVHYNTNKHTCPCAAGMLNLFWCPAAEGSPTASKSRTPSVKSCLKYEILCYYRDSDSILVLVP